jgi:hypothetical protein
MFRVSGETSKPQLDHKLMDLLCMEMTYMRYRIARNNGELYQ